MYVPEAIRQVEKGHRLALLAIIVGSILLNVGSWVAALLLFPADDPTTVLHYSINVGVDFIGEGAEIVSLPSIGSMVLVLNVIVGLAVMRANPRASWVLWGVLPLIQLILLLAFILLWRINTGTA